MHINPPNDCQKCPRLAQLRSALKTEHPSWFNAPVPTYGPENAALLVVGLAPGKKGANRTGTPFCGDAAGEILYPALIRFGLAEARDYDTHTPPKMLHACIANAVRCVPPQNKPETSEIANCNGWLAKTIDSLPNLVAIFALGGIAHRAVLRTYSMRPSLAPFSHGSIVDLTHPAHTRTITMFSSYHCSRYNMNTRRLTVPMFEAALRPAAELALSCN